MKNTLFFLLLGLIILVNSYPVTATEIIVSNLPELQNAINNVQDGDTISLLTGNYGDLVISGKNNNSFVTIRAKNGEIPLFTSITVNNSTYWNLVGLHIKPRYTNGADGNEAVYFDGDFLSLKNCNINFSDNITGWTESEWLARSGNGIIMNGTNQQIINNNITIVDHGIACSASNSLVSNNIISNFRGDGIRGLADSVIYEFNIIKNAYDVDDNHDDGFQSWSYGSNGVGTGTVYNVTLRGNTIINFEDPNQSFKGELQGIGLFDGMFENWIVENNLIITNHWHGISFYGAINCKIINNTVLDNDDEPEPDPWIMITDHKNGTSSFGTIVRNNIANDYSFSGGVTEDHNIEISMSQASIYFVNPDGGTGDYHLTQSNPAIDSGSEIFAPPIDIDNVLRPQGSGYDIGAYEFTSTTSVDEEYVVNDFKLYQNYPNPFNPSTNIEFHISEPGLVSLKVYDMLGAEVATLVSEYKFAGKYEVKFNAEELSTGIYFYRLKAGDYTATKKMLLMK